MATRKICLYKGCNSVSTFTGCRETFFQFPRDPERYEIWKKNGRCDDIDAKNPKYFCSKHFDERKYIASNPRRKLLLANAVPYEYHSDEENEKVEQLQNVSSHIMKDEEEDDEEFLTDPEYENPDCGYAESSIEISSGRSQLANVMYDYSQKKRKFQVESSDSPMKPETKILKVSKLSTKFNLLSDTLISNSSPEGCDATEPLQDTLDDDIPTNPNVTTFIFKGEEYIQMPKHFYLQEKQEIMRELQYFKDKVIKLKTFVDNIKL